MTCNRNNIDLVKLLESCYDYLSSSKSIYNENLIEGLKSSTELLFLSVVDTVVALSALFLYFVVLVLKLGNFAFPYLYLFGNVVVDFHRTQLSTSDIIIEVTVLTTLSLYFLYRKRIQRAWISTLKLVDGYSRKASQVLPHALFFATAAILAVFGRKFLGPLTSSKGLPLVTLIIPVISTIRILPQSQSKPHENVQLQIWIVLAVYHSTATAVSLIPYSIFINEQLYILRAFIVVLLTWAQLLPTFSTLLLNYTQPILKRYIEMAPGANLSAENGISQQIMSIFSTARMLRIITENQEKLIKMALKALFQEGFSLLVASVFCLMPTRISMLGVIIVCLLFPAYRTLTDTLNLTSKHSNTGTKNTRSASQNGYSTNVDRGAAGLPESEAMLRYWFCLGVLWSLRVYGFRLWPSAMMLLCIWLQSKTFQGAASLMRYVQDVSLAMVHRNKQIQHDRLQVASAAPLQGDGDHTADAVESRDTPSVAEPAVITDTAQPPAPTTTDGTVAVSPSALTAEGEAGREPSAMGMDLETAREKERKAIANRAAERIAQLRTRQPKVVPQDPVQSSEGMSGEEARPRRLRRSERRASKLPPDSDEDYVRVTGEDD